VDDVLGDYGMPSARSFEDAGFEVDYKYSDYKDALAALIEGGIQEEYQKQSKVLFS
jgi:hypothetical protein